MPVHEDPAIRDAPAGIEHGDLSASATALRLRGAAASLRKPPDSVRVRVGRNGHWGAASPMAAIYQSASVAREIDVNDRFVRLATAGPEPESLFGFTPRRPFLRSSGQ